MPLRALLGSHMLDNYARRRESMLSCYSIWYSGTQVLDGALVILCCKSGPLMMEEAGSQVYVDHCTRTQLDLLYRPVQSQDRCSSPESALQQIYLRAFGYKRMGWYINVCIRAIRGISHLDDALQLGFARLGSSAPCPYFRAVILILHFIQQDSLKIQQVFTLKKISALFDIRDVGGTTYR